MCALLMMVLPSSSTPSTPGPAMGGDEDEDWGNATPGGTRRRLRSAVLTADPAGWPARRFDYKVSLFTQGLSRAFLVAVPHDDDFKVSKRDVARFNAAELLGKLQEFERLVRIDRNWTLDIYKFLDEPGVANALGWGPQDQDCLDSIARRFNSATPGALAPSGGNIPTPEKKKGWP